MRLVLWECRFRRKMEEGMEDSLYNLRLELWRWGLGWRAEVGLEDRLYTVRLVLYDWGFGMRTEGCGEWTTVFILRVCCSVSRDLGGKCRGVWRTVCRTVCRL